MLPPSAALSTASRRTATERETVLAQSRLGRLVCASAFALALLGGGRARAQGNDLSAPTGGRSALMGNTGVALARDGSAPFLNPATIVRIDDNSLAFSVNFYTFAATSFAGLAPAGARGHVALRQRRRSTGLRSRPTAFASFRPRSASSSRSAASRPRGSNDGGLHRGRQKLAVCFGSTEFEDVVLPALVVPGQHRRSGRRRRRSRSRASWNRFQAGPTYSISLSDDFAIGASLHGVYTSESFVLDSSSITSAAGGGAVQSSLGAGGVGARVRLRGDPRGGLPPRERHARGERSGSRAARLRLLRRRRCTASTASRAPTPRRSPAVRGPSPRPRRCGSRSARAPSGSASSSSSTSRSSCRWPRSARR